MTQAQIKKSGRLTAISYLALCFRTNPTITIMVVPALASYLSNVLEANVPRSRAAASTFDAADSSKPLQKHQKRREIVKSGRCCVEHVIRARGVVYSQRLVLSELIPSPEPWIASIEEATVTYRVHIDQWEPDLI
nr:hypothetical protein CFP56_34724 [Quercus suber]